MANPQDTWFYHFVPDLTLTTSKSSEPRACRNHPQGSVQETHLELYRLLHLLSFVVLWFFAMHLKNPPPPPPPPIHRSRDSTKQTLGAVMSSMNSLNNFAFCSLSYQSRNLPGLSPSHFPHSLYKILHSISLVTPE